MIDKAICAFNRFVVNFFASLTITVKTPFIDFSFVPLMIKPIGFKNKCLLSHFDRRHLIVHNTSVFILYIISFCINM